jgi:hypothetical protein
VFDAVEILAGIAARPVLEPILPTLKVDIARDGIARARRALYRGGRHRTVPSRLLPRRPPSLGRRRNRPSTNERHRGDGSPIPRPHAAAGRKRGIEASVSINLRCPALDDVTLADRMTAIVEAQGLTPRRVSSSPSRPPPAGLARARENSDALRIEGLRASPNRAT